MGPPFAARCSPLPSSSPFSATVLAAAPPPLMLKLPSARKTMTLMAISATVTCGAVVMSRMRTTLVRWLAQSGQRIPTGVVVMQSGQMGLPQLEQETAVSREGWR